MYVNHIKNIDPNSKDLSLDFLLFNARQYSCAKFLMCISNWSLLTGII